MGRFFIAFAVFMLAVRLSPPAHAQKLDQFEEQFDREGPHSPEKTSDHRDAEYIERENQEKSFHDSARPTDSCDDITNILGCIVGTILFSPFQAAIDGKKFPLSAYPYQHEVFPFLVPMETKESRSVSITTSLAYQWVHSDVHGVMTDLHIRSRYRIGGRINYIYYNEEQESGDDRLNVLSYSVNVIPAEDARYMIDLALGGVALIGDNDEAGPSFSVGGLIFPMKPLVVELRGGVAMIRYRALWDFSVEVGGNIGWAELFTGYRSLNGPIENIGGPYFGARIWF